MAARSPAKRRYIRVHLALSIAYVLLVMLASRFVPDDAEPSVPVILWSTLPGVVVLGWIWNMGRFLVELEDEYIRLLEVRKFMVATGLTLAITSVWGLIELYSTVPRLPVFFVFPIWCLGLAAGSLVNRLTIGDSGDSS